jgi:hypothetical protein
MSARTWEIRDQLPDGSWSDKRTVTLAQYRAEIEAAKERAMIAFRASLAGESK